MTACGKCGKCGNPCGNLCVNNSLFLQVRAAQFAILTHGRLIERARAQAREGLAASEIGSRRTHAAHTAHAAHRLMWPTCVIACGIGAAPRMPHARAHLQPAFALKKVEGVMR